MNELRIGDIIIEDTFAEAFRMRYSRLVFTAATERWANTAATESTGYASSIIACDVEAGLESTLSADQTPDGRPGVSVLFFGFSSDGLAAALPRRVGQCVLTCPTTAVYDGMSHDDPELPVVPLGSQLRYFGDGFQKSKVIGERRYWRIPVMDGEFLVEEKARAAPGIAGGNFLIEGRDPGATRISAERAVEAIAKLPDVITPFPGGIARSGSKVGSKYKALRASTNEAFCPTLRTRVSSQLHPEARCVYEIIINGTSAPAIERAMRDGIQAACDGKDASELVAISAGNYGGKLGKFHFRLHDVLA